MPDLRISQLLSLPLPITGSEVIPIVRQPGVVTNKITVNNLAAFITGGLNASTASYAISSSLAQTASYINVTGSGISVNWFGSQLQLTGSTGGGSVGTLQSVTTAGNQTSASIVITGSLSQGNLNRASGQDSHAEGIATLSSGIASHTEGRFTTAVGEGSHAEGVNTVALGFNSHAEGRLGIAFGFASHTEGEGCGAYANYSHVGGNYSEARGDHSFAHGWSVISGDKHQFVVGQYNQRVSGSGSFIVGGGPNDFQRTNLIYTTGSVLQINGSLQITGSVSILNTPGTPANTATPNRWIPFTHNGQAGFIPFYV
jgi:hypothetical protein